MRQAAFRGLATGNYGMDLLIVIATSIVRRPLKAPRSRACCVSTVSFGGEEGWRRFPEVLRWRRAFELTDRPSSRECCDALSKLRAEYAGSIYWLAGIIWLYSSLSLVECCAFDADKEHAMYDTALSLLEGVC